MIDRDILHLHSHNHIRSHLFLPVIHHSHIHYFWETLSSSFSKDFPPQHSSFSLLHPIYFLLILQNIHNSDSHPHLLLLLLSIVNLVNIFSFKICKLFLFHGFEMYTDDFSYKTFVHIRLGEEMLFYYLHFFKTGFFNGI